MKTYQVKGKRSVNIKNCYILFISTVAVFSLVGNFFQDAFYNKAIAIQQETIETMSIDNNQEENTAKSDEQQFALNDEQD